MNIKWKLLIWATLIFTIQAGCSPADKVFIAEPTPIAATSAVQAEAPALPTGSTPAAAESLAESTLLTVTSAMQGEATTIPAQLPTQDFFPGTSSGKMPVIFIHGGGPCDIGALVYLTKHPNIDLIGLVLSFGEFHPVNAMDEWPVFLYDILDYDSAAIGLGSDAPLDPKGHAFPEEWRNLADDFWGLDLHAPGKVYDPAVGYELIVHLIKNSPQKVTILIMSGQTDLALALMNDPGIADHIANIVIMGGAFTIPGNLAEGPEKTTNEAAEWNMYIDPKAAKVVFNSGAPISVIPLDAIQYLVQSKDMDMIYTYKDPGVRYVAQMWNQQWGWSNQNGFLIWDTITAIAVTNPEYFKWTYDGVDVITDLGDFQGQTIPLHNGARHIRYATDADYDAILDQLFDVFSRETSAAAQETLITELAGTWTGFTGHFHITFYLNEVCRVNEKCGTFEIPEFSLTGDVTIINITGNIYEFKVTNMSSGQPGNEYEYLQLLEDGTIKYHTEGSGTINEAILYRQ